MKRTALSLLFTMSLFTGLSEFVNGDYKYEYSIVVLGKKDSPPAYSNVYKGEKGILSQKAGVVTQ